MSTAVWPFTLLRPYSERAVHETTVYEANGGIEATRAEFGTYGRMTVRARVRLPYGGQTAADWHAFLVARQGGYDTFLYKCILERHKKVTAEAVGTGTGSQTAFALDMRHIDASTLLVYVAGVLQTLTTHYTVSGNNTAPTITFLSAPTLGQAVTATYEYYYPMRLVEGGDDSEPEHLHDTGSDSTTIIQTREIVMQETTPGAHRA